MKIYKYLIVVALLFSNNSLIAQSCYCAFLTNFKAIQQSNNQVKVAGMQIQKPLAPEIL
jgi:hypothetical protein